MTLDASLQHKVQILANSFAETLRDHVGKYLPNKKTLNPKAGSFELGLTANFYPFTLFFESVPQLLSEEFLKAQKQVKFAWNEIDAKEHDNVRRLLADKTIIKVNALLERLVQDKDCVSIFKWKTAMTGTFFGLGTPWGISIDIGN